MSVGRRRSLFHLIISSTSSSISTLVGGRISQSVGSRRRRLHGSLFLDSPLRFEEPGGPYILQVLLSLTCLPALLLLYAKNKIFAFCFQLLCLTYLWYSPRRNVHMYVIIQNVHISSSHSVGSRHWTAVEEKSNESRARLARH